MTRMAAAGVVLRRALRCALLLCAAAMRSARPLPGHATPNTPLSPIPLDLASLVSGATPANARTARAPAQIPHTESLAACAVLPLPPPSPHFSCHKCHTAHLGCTLKTKKKVKLHSCCPPPTAGGRCAACPTPTAPGWCWTGHTPRSRALLLLLRCGRCSLGRRWRSWWPWRTTSHTRQLILNRVPVSK